MSSEQHSRPGLLGILGAAWGALGVCGMIGSAIYRLTPVALQAYDEPLPGWLWAVVGAMCVFMAYSEGYRGFQLRFSPRTAARIRYLRDHPNLLNTLLAPLFAFGFFRADRRTRITAYALSAAILILVIVVHRIEQPWRGIIDTGVVLGLVWGIISLIWCIVQALTRPTFEHSPAMPASLSEDATAP